MAEFEFLIPVDPDDDDDDDQPAGSGTAVRRSSSFSRASLARFSQRFRRRGWTVGADDGGGQDKENDVRRIPPAVAAVKRVKFDKRVYHGPVRTRGGIPAPFSARGILKTSTAPNRTAAGGGGYTNAGRDSSSVPNRMRMYDVPVTSFYIGVGEHLELPALAAVKRCATAADAGERESKKTRRFGTEIGSYNNGTNIILRLFARLKQKRSTADIKTRERGPPPAIGEFAIPKNTGPF